MTKHRAKQDLSSHSVVMCFSPKPSWSDPCWQEGASCSWRSLNTSQCKWSIGLISDSCTALPHGSAHSECAVACQWYLWCAVEQQVAIIKFRHHNAGGNWLCCIIGQYCMNWMWHRTWWTVDIYFGSALWQATDCLNKSTRNVWLGSSRSRFLLSTVNHTTERWSKERPSVRTPTSQDISNWLKYPCPWTRVRKMQNYVFLPSPKEERQYLLKMLLVTSGM